jgi:hypothetical protein
MGKRPRLRFTFPLLSRECPEEGNRNIFGFPATRSQLECRDNLTINTSNPLATSIFVFGCAFGGALLGLFIHRLLPDRHLSPESKDVARLGMGLVATTMALVLGLLVASAKGFYDTQTNEVTQLAANVVLLDRVLAHY